MNLIIIKQLSIETIIGLYDWERQQPQPLLFDLEIETDFSAVIASDNMQDGTDYALIAEQIQKICDRQQFRLLEPLANQIIDTLFDIYPINKIDITINKPNALSNAVAAGVRLVRYQQYANQ